MTEKVPSITAFGPSVHGFSDPPRNLYFLKNTLSLSFGGGPGSAVAAMYLLRQGITPVITERDDHPRFHVGESLRSPGRAESMVKRERKIQHASPCAGNGRQGTRKRRDQRCQSAGGHAP